jgi:hypothetical protein
MVAVVATGMQARQLLNTNGIGLAGHSLLGRLG